MVCIEALKTTDIGALPRICERCPAHSFLDGSAAIPLRDMVHEGHALRCCSIDDGGAKEDDGCALECASGKRLRPLDAIRSCIAGKAPGIEWVELGERSPAPSVAAECNPEEGQEQKDENDGGHLISVSGYGRDSAVQLSSSRRCRALVKQEQAMRDAAGLCWKPSSPPGAFPPSSDAYA